jgi:hypothetical protein
MSDFKTEVEVLIGKPPDGFKWQPSRMYMLQGEVTCAFKPVPLWVPLWVPPKGVFKPGWITRYEGGPEFWWHEDDPDYETDEGVWVTEGDSMLLFGIHPDSLPPLTIPAHLCKFRVGDD